MFGKNRAIQVKVVNTKKNNETPAPEMAVTIGESSARIITDLAKDFTKYAAATIVGAIVIVKAVDTLKEIAVKKTKSADN